MGLFSWLFRKKKRDYETPKRYTGVPYGTKPPEPPKPPAEVSEQRPGEVKICREYYYSNLRVHALFSNCAVFVRHKSESQPVEYKSTGGVTWYNSDGGKLRYEVADVLYNVVQAKKLFGEKL